MSRIEVIPVAPIGKREVIGFITGSEGCGPSMTAINAYPEAPRAKELRDRRLGADLTLREWADVLGVSVVEASGLERGSHTVNDWDALFAILDGESEGV